MRYRFFFLQHSIILDSDPTCQLSATSFCSIQFRWRDVLYQQLEKIEEALGGNFCWIHRSERFKVVAPHLVTCGRLQLQKVLEELLSKMEQQLSVFLIPSVPTCPLILVLDEMPCKVGPKIFYRKAKRYICADGQLSDRVDPALRVKVRPFPGILVMQRHGFVILEWYLIGNHPSRPIIGEKTSCGLIGTIGDFFPTNTKFIISCVSLNLAFQNSWSKADFSSIMK